MDENRKMKLTTPLQEIKVHNSVNITTLPIRKVAQKW